MNEVVPTEDQGGGRCAYCSAPLDPSYTFCLRCAQPYKPSIRILPSEPYLDDEVRIRTLAPQSIQVFLWILVIVLVPGMILSALVGPDNSAVTILFVQLALLVATVILATIHSHALSSQLNPAGTLSPYLLIGLLGTLGLIAVNVAYHVTLLELLGDEIRPEINFDEIFHTLGGKILFICILPGITEEIAFRGLIQHWLHIAFPPLKAIFVTSVLFSLVHFSLLSAPYFVLVGMFWGWLRWKSGSLYPCIIAHTAHNLVVVLIKDTYN